MWHREPRAFSHILFTPDSRSLLLAGEGFRHTRAIRRLDAEHDIGSVARGCIDEVGRSSATGR